MEIPWIAILSADHPKGFGHDYFTLIHSISKRTLLLTYWNTIKLQLNGDGVIGNENDKQYRHY